MDLVLASNSPRRSQLLTSMGYKYQIITSEVEECINFNISPCSTAMSLAYQKGIVVANDNPNNVVLSADTLVYCNNQIIGKPKDYHDAFRILSMLSDNWHHVVTGFSIISIENNIRFIDCEISKVKFKSLTKEEIIKYLSHDEAYDKAGAYAIQGIGKAFVESYVGSFNNIIGLPTEKLEKILNQMSL